MCVAKSNRSHADLTQLAKEPVTLFCCEERKNYSRTRIGTIIQGNGSSLISLHYTSHLNKTIFLSCLFAAASLPRKSYKILWLDNESSKREKDIKYNGLGACRSGENLQIILNRAAANIFLLHVEEIWLKYGASSLVSSWRMLLMKTCKSTGAERAGGSICIIINSTFAN